MYGKDGEVKLIDFGLAKTVKRGANSQLYTIAGTQYYMAPEVLDGEYNWQCDIWSVGILLYVLLSGKFPFYDENLSVLYDKI